VVRKQGKTLIMHNITKLSLMVAKYNVECYNELFLSETCTQAEVQEEIVCLITEKRPIYKPNNDIRVRKLYRIKSYV